VRYLYPMLVCLDESIIVLQQNADAAAVHGKVSVFLWGCMAVGVDWEKAQRSFDGISLLLYKDNFFCLSAKVQGCCTKYACTLIFSKPSTPVPQDPSF
jgi:hypothetical protein